MGGEVGGNLEFGIWNLGFVKLDTGYWCQLGCTAGRR